MPGSPRASGGPGPTATPQPGSIAGEQTPAISIVLPARNEAAIIAASVRRVAEVLTGLGRTYEIIVADSASTDGTSEAVVGLRMPHVRVVRAEQPGKGAAIRLGLQAARGHYIGFVDSDLEIGAEELPRLVGALDEGADAAIATKTDRSGERPLRRRLSTVVYNALVRAAFGTSVRDHQAGMKLFQGDAATAARRVQNSGWFWDTEVLVTLDRQGCRVSEIRVATSPGRTGRLSVAPVAWELLRGLVRLRLSRAGRTLRPLRLESSAPSTPGELAPRLPDPGVGARGSSAGEGEAPVGATPGHPHVDVPGTGHEHPWGLLAALLCSAALLWLFQPRWLVSPGTPAGFDLSGHFYPFGLAAHQLLSHGRIHGWSSGWFTGFPLFYFYFPLPAFIATALSPFIGFAAAFKVMSVLGILGYPLAVWWLLSELRLRQTVVAVATVSACGLLFTGYPDLGANIPSTLGGEFSYSIAFTLSLAYLAAVLRARRRPERSGPLVLAIALLAATALSHTIATAAVVLAVAPLLADARGRKVVLYSWVVGFLLAGFWALPFLVRAGFMFAPFSGNAPLRRAFIPGVVHTLPIALAGGFLLRRSRPAWPLAWLGLLSLAAAAIPQHAFLSLRFLPYWYASVFIFAGVAAGLLAERGLRLGSPAAVLGTCVLVVVPLLGAARYPFLHRWAGWEFSGLEQKPSWPAVQGLISVLRKAPPGRIYWEDDQGAFARAGSRNIMTLLPQWAPGHDALGGLWVESSPTAAVVRGLDREIAQAARARAGSGAWRPIARKLGALGVRYFLTVRPTSAAKFAAVPGARALWTAPPLALFEIPAAPLVQTPAGEPAADSIRISAGEIRFHTTALGVPHRIAVSFFPNWVAEGAAGPVRAGPFMNVVPTRPEVVLRFRTTWVEVLGSTFTGLGLLLLAGMALRSRRARVTEPARDPRALPALIDPLRHQA